MTGLVLLCFTFAPPLTILWMSRLCYSPDHSRYWNARAAGQEARDVFRFGNKVKVEIMVNSSAGSVLPAGEEKIEIILLAIIGSFH